MGKPTVAMICDKCKKVVMLDNQQKYGLLTVREKRAEVGNAIMPIKETTIMKFEHCLCPECYSEYMTWINY